MKKRFDFAVSDTPRLDLRLPLGDLKIAAGVPGTVEISLDGKDSAVERIVVEQRGDTIHLEPDRNERIRWSSVDVRVMVGDPAMVHVRLTSGDLIISTDVATLAVETASGEITAGKINGDATIRSASGDVELVEVAGRLDVAVASGDVRAGTVGEAEIKSASGDVTVREVQRDASLKSASGEIVVGLFSGQSFEAKTMSGDISLGVPSGRRYEVLFSTISGDVATDFPVQGNGESSGAPARLEIKTVSGDIRIKGAS
jgi:DUF4097 and DUF4098 domain-containing protein YvlB